MSDSSIADFYFVKPMLTSRNGMCVTSLIIKRCPVLTNLGF